MELKLPTAKQLETAYKRDFAPSFPATELRPLRAIERLTAECGYRPWCLFDGDDLLGEAFVWQAGERYVLFDYLCITQSRRNDGLGAKLIGFLLEAERGNVLFGESEIPAYASDPAMAERRLAFYRRCGAKRAFYDTALFGVPYHTLYWADGAVDETEMQRFHAAVYRDHMKRKIYDACIRIPWDQSTSIPKKIKWEE